MPVDHAAEIQKQIDDLLAPLRSRDTQLSREIAEHQTAILELRILQTKVRALVRASDPGYQKPNGSKKKPRQATKLGPAEENRATRLGEWLLRNAAQVNTGEGFYATKLVREHGDQLPPGLREQSPVSRALMVLHERGVVRLVAVNSGPGGKKMFKVVV